jgi:putative NADPH-quinone reductase
MKHLIVVCHPVDDSFTFALARVYADELEIRAACRFKDLNHL